MRTRLTLNHLAATGLAMLLSSTAAHSHHRCNGKTDHPYADVVSIGTFRNNDVGFTAEATVTHIPEGKLTAAHALLGIRSDYRPHRKLDITAMIERPVDRPNVSYGDNLTLVGYPAGCKRSIALQGTAYVERFPGELVVMLNNEVRPIAQGMSGGAALNAKGEVVGIIVNSNHPLDLDDDGTPDQSADIVLLHYANLKPRL